MKKIKITICFASLIFFSSCSDFLEVTDLDELSSGSVFKTEADMSFALNHLYTLLPSPDFDNTSNSFLRPYFWTDDAIHRNINNSEARQGSDFQWITNTTILRGYYRYNHLADINFFLEAVPGAEYSSEELRNRHGAEARFIRAMIYERMVFTYGDVPLITEIIEPTDLPARDPRLEVFNFVIGELDEIDDQLPEVDGYESGDEGRITKGAVLALKRPGHI